MIMLLFRYKIAIENKKESLLDVMGGHASWLEAS